MVYMQDVNNNERSGTLSNRNQTLAPEPYQKSMGTSNSQTSFAHSSMLAGDLSQRKIVLAKVPMLNFSKL